MKKILLICIATTLFAQSTERPIVELPTDLTVDWFRQSSVIDAARYKQVIDIGNMQEYCTTKNLGKLQSVLNKDNNQIFVCNPTQDK